jgi:hypothetical protein
VLKDETDRKQGKVKLDIKPVLILMPGIAGHNDDLYIIKFSNEAIKQGY